MSEPSARLEELRAKTNRTPEEDAELKRLEESEGTNESAEDDSEEEDSEDTNA